VIRAVAPCRADLAGGTLDIWPLGMLFAGAQTVNVALDLEVEVTLERRPAGYRLQTATGVVEAASLEELATQPDGALIGVAGLALEVPPVAIELRSASPRGGGLGASSAMTVAFIAAADRLVGRRDLEARLMRLPTGMQDHYAAISGGALAITFAPGGETVRPLAVDLDELGSRMLLVYSGQSHFSAATNWEIIRGCLEERGRIRALFAGIAEVAAAVTAGLERGDWETVGRLVGEEWALRRQLAEGVTVPAVDELLAVARSAGAWGGKAGGAGGGGSVILLLPPERREAVETAVRRAGGQVLVARPTASRLRIA
jgi:D-glycero-alpha-D-manno-heptose-7-phosphate kinase